MKIHQTSPNYLRYLKLFVLSGLIVSLNILISIFLIESKDWRVYGYSQWISLIINFISETILSGIFWYIVGNTFNQLKASIISFSIGVLCFILNTILAQFISWQRPSLYLNLSTFISVIPFSVYLYLVIKNTNKVLVGSLIFLVIMGYSKFFKFYLSGSHSIEQIIESFLKVIFPDNVVDHLVLFKYNIDNHTYSYFYYWSIISSIAFYITFLLIKLEILRTFVKTNKIKLKSQLLELSNNYSKPQISLLFFSTRITIDSILFSFFSAQYYSNFYPGFQKYHYYLWISFGLATLFMMIYLHRKYLCEFLIAHNNVPSWFYWFLLIPFANLIIFPIGILFFTNKIELKERIEKLKEASANNGAIWIAFVIVVFQGIALLSSLIHGLFAESIVTFIGMILVIAFMLGKYYNLYILIGWYLALTLIILFSPTLISMGADSPRLVTIPYGIVTVYMLYAIFHIYRFSAVEEDQNQEAAVKQAE